MVNDRIPDYSISSEISDKPKTQRKTQTQQQANVFDELNERLGATLYQYINLYERWSEDRQAFAKRGAELMALLETFQGQVKRLTALNVEQAVAATLNQQCQRITQEIKVSITKVATDQAKAGLWENAQHLRDAANELTAMLQRAKETVTYTRYRWFGLTLVMTIVASLVVAWVVLPAKTYRLTNHEVTLMTLGSELQTLYDQQSAAGQQKLLNSIKNSQAKAMQASTNSEE